MNTKARRHNGHEVSPRISWCFSCPGVVLFMGKSGRGLGAGGGYPLPATAHDNEWAVGVLRDLPSKRAEQLLAAIQSLYTQDQEVRLIG